jgi:hypothetical protein
MKRKRKRARVTSKTEERCRKIFENIFGRKFPPMKFKWLISPLGYPMELDGYCKKLRLAFEYNGAQHYRYTPRFHKSIQEFSAGRKRDRKKLRLCKDHKITVIVIPYTAQDIQRFIIVKSIKLGFKKHIKRSAHIKRK